MKTKTWNGKKWPYKKYCPVGNYDLLCMRCGAWHGKRPSKEEKILDEVFDLIDCEIDLSETNGYDISGLKNLIKRIKGHFNIKVESRGAN